MLIIRFKTPRGIDFPLSHVDDPELLHVTGEHDSLPRQQDAARDATNLYPHDMASDGLQRTRLVNANRSDHPRAIDCSG